MSWKLDKQPGEVYSRLSRAVRWAMVFALLLQLLPLNAQFEVVVPLPAARPPALPAEGVPRPPALARPRPDPRFAQTIGLPFDFGETRRAASVRLPLAVGTAPALAQTSSFAITKSDSPDPVNQGQLLTYLIVLTNTSGSTITTQMVVTDVVPANTVCADIPDVDPWFRGSCLPSTTQFVWTANVPGVPDSNLPLGPGQSVTLTAVLSVREPVPDQTIITNLSNSYAITNAGSLQFGANTVTTTVNAPNWSITKTAQPDPVRPGEALTYTLSLTNTGHLVTSGTFTVTDQIPQFTNLVTATLPFTSDGQFVTWVITDSLGIDQGISLTLVVSPTTPLTDGLLIANDAYTVTGGNVFSDGVGPPLTVTVDAPADLTIVKTAEPEPVRAGGLLTYTITVTNQASATGPALNVVITDTLPPEAIFQDAGIAPPFSGIITPPLTGTNVVTWTLNEPIPVAGSAQVTAAVRITSPAIANTVITNTYDVTASNVPTVEIGPPTISTISSTNAISLAKSVFPDFVAGGDVVTYTIVVTNSGNGIAGVVLTDTLNPAFTGTTGLFTSTFLLPGRDLSGVPGQATRSFTVTAPVTAGVYFNPNVTAAYDGLQTTITDTAPFTVAEPVLNIIKLDEPDPVGVGQFLRYTIVYSNAGGLQADNVVLTDTLDPNVAFITSTLGPPDAVSGNEIGWNLTPVPSASGLITGVITVQVPLTLDDLAVLSNTARIAADRVAVTDTGVITTLVHAPVLSIDKIDAPDPVQAGRLLTYNVVYTNTGHLTATNLVVTDTLDNNVALVSATPPTTTQIGQIVAWDNLPNLPPLGGVGLITAVVRVTAPLTDGTILNNSAVITSAQLKGASAGPISTVVEAAPVFSLVKTENQDPIAAGERLTYTIAYSNVGNALAGGVIVTDTLDSNVAFVAANPAPDTINGQVLVWTFPTLPLSVTQLITVAVDVGSPLPNGTPLVNSVEITSTEGASNTVQITTTVTSAPDLHVAKIESQDPIAAGERLTYTITYSNNGNAIATNALVTDTLDSNVAFVSANPPPDAINGQVLAWDVGSLSPLSGTQVITVAVDVNSPLANGTLLVNDVDIGSGQGAGDAAQITTTVIAPNLNLVKTDAADPVNPGDTLVYTIAYSNTGDAAATNVLITDTFDSNTAFVGASPPPAGGSGQTRTWGPLTLPANSLQTIVVTVTVGAPLPDLTLLTNVVTMTAANAGPAVTDQETTTVRAADVSVSKTVLSDPALAGDPIVYTITYGNAPGAPGADVTITDTLPISVSAAGVISSGTATFAGFVPPRTLVWTDTVNGGQVKTLVVTSTVINGPWPSALLAMTNLVTIALPAPELPQTNADNTDSLTSQGGPNLPFSISLLAVPDTTPIPGPAVITATVEDQFGNPVLDGTGVAFATDLGNVTPSAATGNGRAVATLTSNTVGVATVLATANGVTRTTQVTFTAGPVDHFDFDLIGDQVAGVPFTLTITARDAANNVATDFSGPVALADATGTIAPTTTAPTPFVNGVWTGTVAITRATTLAPPTTRITATAGVTTGVSNDFEVFPGPPAQAALTVAAPQQCGGTAPQSAVVRDQFGNEVLAGVVVTFTTSAGSIESPATTNNVGLATAVLTAPLGPPPVPVTAIVSVDVDGLPPAEDSAVVTFATPARPTDLTLAAVPDTIPLFSSAALTATLTDCEANPLPNADVSFDIVSDPGGTFLSIPSAGQTDANGVFTGTFNAGVFGGVALVRSDATTQTVSLTTTVPITITGGPGFGALKLVEPNTVTVTAGSRLTYTVIVSNTGDAAASGVRITDTIPAGASYVSGSASAVLDEPGVGPTSLPVSGPSPLVVDVGTITPGGVVTFAFQVTAISGPTVSNVATVGSDQLPEVNSNPVATGVVEGVWLTYLPLVMKNFVPPQPDLVVDVVQVSPVSPQVGQEVIISVTVRNSSAVNVPPGVTFWVDAYITTEPVSPGVNVRWNDVPGAHGVAWRVPALGAGQSLTFSNLTPNNQLVDPNNCKNFSDFTPSTVGGCTWPANTNRFGAAGTYYVVALVDSFAEDSSIGDGNVSEADESNNLSPSVTVVVSPGVSENGIPAQVPAAGPEASPAEPGQPRPALLPKEE